MRSSFLQLHTDGGEIDAAVDVDNPDVLKDLLDAQVLVTGAASGRFEGKMQQTGVLLHVELAGRRKSDQARRRQSLDSAHYADGRDSCRLSRQQSQSQGAGSWNDHLLSAGLGGGIAGRRSRSLWLMTSSIAPLRDRATLPMRLGFPDVHDGFLALTGAEIQDRGTQAPVDPKHATWDELSTSKYLFDLVSIDGDVVAEVRGAGQDEYVLEADGNLFSAIYKHPSAASQVPIRPRP